MEEIPTVSELITLYDKGELKGEEGSWYKCYMTDLARERGNVGFMPYSELAGHSSLRKEFKLLEMKLLWGK